MLDLSASLIRRLLPLITQNVPKPEGFRTWIQSGSYYFAAGTGPDSFLLQDVSLTEFVPYVSYDYERFALSSLESLLFCGPDSSRPKAIGWAIVKLYYSAFFGAHAIMRATGRGLIRLEAPQAASLSKIAAFYAPDLTISPGSYNTRAIQDPRLTIDIGLSKIGDGGGAHDQFWRNFYNFLNDIT